MTVPSRSSRIACLLALALPALLAACAAPPQARPAAPPRFAPAPPGVVHRSAVFTGKDGTELFEQSWCPTAATRSALVLVHGLKDHSSRYAVLGEDLARRGVAVFAADLRGHANSGGRRVWIEGFDEYVADLDALVERARARVGAKMPLFVFGHSMGGAIATEWALDHAALPGRPRLAGLILSAPALRAGADVSRALIASTKALSTVGPALAVFDLPNENFSRDPKVIAEMSADPLIYQGNGPARTAAELLRALERIGDRMEEVQTPLLILHGTEDRVTDPDGSRELYNRSVAKDKTLRTFPGMWHDLMHEPEGPQIRGEIVKWISDRSPAKR